MQIPVARPAHLPRPAGLKQDHLGLYLDGQLPNGSYIRVPVEEPADISFTFRTV